MQILGARNVTCRGLLFIYFLIHSPSVWEITLPQFAVQVFLDPIPISQILPNTVFQSHGGCDQFKDDHVIQAGMTGVHLRIFAGAIRKNSAFFLLKLTRAAFSTMCSYEWSQQRDK